MNGKRTVTINGNIVLEALFGLALALVLLRFCGIIHVRWVWALAPAWIPLAISTVYAFFITRRQRGMWNGA